MSRERGRNVLGKGEGSGNETRKEEESGRKPGGMVDVGGEGKDREREAERKGEKREEKGWKTGGKGEERGSNQIGLQNGVKALTLPKDFTLKNLYFNETN
jgi:hypothetical protein